MVGDMGHMSGLINPRPGGADNTELVFQIPVGLPSLERERRVKKRVDLLSYESKPTEKQEQYDWRAE